MYTLRNIYILLLATELVSNKAKQEKEPTKQQANETKLSEGKKRMKKHQAKLNISMKMRHYAVFCDDCRQYLLFFCVKKHLTSNVRAFSFFNITDVHNQTTFSS